MFLTQVTMRPLYAHVAKQHGASIRVLQTCGFTRIGEVGDEFVLTL